MGTDRWVAQRSRQQHEMLIGHKVCGGHGHKGYLVDSHGVYVIPRVEQKTGLELMGMDEEVG